MIDTTIRRDEAIYGFVCKSQGHSFAGGFSGEPYCTKCGQKLSSLHTELAS